MKLIRTRPGLIGEEAKDFNELSAKVSASSALVLDDDCRWAAQALQSKIYMFVVESHGHTEAPPDPQPILALSRLHTDLSEALARRMREIYLNRSQPKAPRLRP